MTDRTFTSTLFSMFVVVGYKMAGVCFFLKLRYNLFLLYSMACLLLLLLKSLHQCARIERSAYLLSFVFTQPLRGFFPFCILNVYIVSRASVVMVTGVPGGWICAALLVWRHPVAWMTEITLATVCAGCRCAACTTWHSKHFRNKCQTVLSRSSSDVRVPSDPVPGEPLQRRPAEADGWAHDLHPG